MPSPLSSAVIALERRARQNRGLFTSADADQLGVSDAVIAYHSRLGGRWERVFPRVYRLVAIPQSPRQIMLAALMWAGADTVLSHREAGFTRDLDGVRARIPRPELWSPRCIRHRGVVVHRASAPLPSFDVTRMGPLRLTSLRRTVVDLAAVLDDDTLELVVESAYRTSRTLNLDPAPGERGAERLRRVLARRPPGCLPTESELETRYLQLARRAGLPPTTRQHPICDDMGRCLYRLDVFWPEAHLWVELDGRSWHDHPAAVLSDRHRQNEIATRMDLLPLRFTWDDVVTHADSTTATTVAAYRQRRVNRAS